MSGKVGDHRSCGSTPSLREVDQALQPSGTVEAHPALAAWSQRAGVCDHAAVPRSIVWWGRCRAAALLGVGAAIKGGTGTGLGSGWGEGAGWDTLSCTWGWGGDPWHPQLSDGGSIQASWCVLRHPAGTFWGVPAHCSPSRRAALWQRAVPPRDWVRAGAAAG